MTGSSRLFVFSGIVASFVALAIFFVLNIAQTDAQTTPVCPAIIRSLSVGMTGTDVTSLQQFLIGQNLLLAGSANGTFGPETEQAVQKFQTQQGIVTAGTYNTTGYGLVGPRTRAAMLVVCGAATSAPVPVTPAPLPTTTGTGPIITRQLGIGSSGADVTALQQFLKTSGYYTFPTITGYYGPFTAAAVAAYQRANGLEAVGVVGPLTRARLAQGAGTGVATTPSPAVSTPTVSEPPRTTTVRRRSSGGGGGGGGGGSSTPTPDTTAPVITNGTPTGTQPVNTTGATLGVSTDETAACRYATTSAVAFLSMTAFTTSSSTSHSSSISGLTNGSSHTYYVKCQDDLGNTNSSDYSFSFSVAADTSAPTVSVTAPTQGSTVSGSAVALTASASDDVGIAGVTFRVDGAVVGSEDTSSPFTVNWDSTATTSGSHTVYAVARDTTNNYATSSTITFTVGAAPANTVLPAITGTATENETLTSSQGTWNNTPTAYAYQWAANGTNISGATSSTYLLTSSEVGKTITSRVTASNAFGTTSTTSTATATVSAAASPQLYVVSTVSRLPTDVGAAVSTNRGFVIRYPFYIGSGDVTEMRFSFANLYSSMASNTTGNSITITEASLDNGTSYAPVTFNGSTTRSKVLAWKDSDIQSDPIYPSALGLSEFARGELYWFKVVGEATSTTYKWPLQYPRLTNFTGQQSYVFDPGSVTPDADSAGTFSTSGLTTTSNPLPGPVILGKFENAGTRSFLGVGDSIFRGADDEVSTFRWPLKILSGIFERSLVDQMTMSTSTIYAGLNTGVFGTGVANYSTSYDARSAYYQYATDIVEEYGTNDAPSLTLSGIQTKLGQLWTTIASTSPNARLWRTKLMPRTTSTDNWATVANQSVNADNAQGGEVSQLNDWFDTKYADTTLDGVIELGRMRDPASTTAWRVNPTGGITVWPTSDGVHPGVYVSVPTLADEMRTYWNSSITAAPGSVSNLEATTSDTTLTATWTAPAQPVNDYIVEIKPSLGSTWTTVHTYDTATAYNWTGLASSTSYDIRVTPANYKGDGSASTASATTLGTLSGYALDSLTATSTGAYSSRRLRAGYTGPALMVRRFDGMEAPLYFNAAGDLDTAWASAFARGGNLTVRRRYDQSGTTTHFSAAYAAVSYSPDYFPVLMSTGTMNTVNGKAADYFNTTRFYQVSSLTSNPPGSRAVVFVQSPTGNASSQSILGGGNAGGYNIYMTTSRKTVLEKESTSNVVVATNAMATGATSLVSVVYDGVSNGIWTDTVANGTSTTAATFTSGAPTATLGVNNTGNSGGAFTGYIPEICVFDGVTLSTQDRQSLENSMKSYWGTP